MYLNQLELDTQFSIQNSLTSLLCGFFKLCLFFHFLEIFALLPLFMCTIVCMIPHPPIPFTLG